MIQVTIVFTVNSLDEILEQVAPIVERLQKVEVPSPGNKYTETMGNVIGGRAAIDIRQVNESDNKAPLISLYGNLKRYASPS